MRSLLHKSDISNKINTLKAKLNENLTGNCLFSMKFKQNCPIMIDLNEIYTNTRIERFYGIVKTA